MMAFECEAIKVPEHIVDKEGVDSFGVAKYGKFHFVSANHFLHSFIHQNYFHPTILIHHDIIDFHFLLKCLLLESPIHFRIEHAHFRKCVIFVQLLSLIAFLIFAYLKAFCTFLRVFAHLTMIRSKVG